MYQANQLMNFNFQPLAAPVDPMDALPMTIALARLLIDADQRFSDARQIDGIAHPTILAGGWVITARSGDPRPNSFGVYGSCDPRRRCVGCSSGCTSEQHLIELSRRTGDAPVLWLERGMPVDRSPWMQIQVWMPLSPALSGNWVPHWAQATQRMELASTDATTAAVIAPAGSLIVTGLTASPFRLHRDRDLMQNRWTYLVYQHVRIEAPDPVAANTTRNLRAS